MAKALNLIEHGQEQGALAYAACPAPHVFGHVHCKAEYVGYPHVQYLGKVIARAVARGNGRLIVNMPPRLGKTFLLSQLTPAWFLELWPEKRVLATGHSDALADESGRWVRNLFEHSPSLKTKLRADSTAADRWNTEEGGGMKTGGVGSGLTGFGGHLIIVDDPYKDVQDAYSATYNRHLREWWNGVLLYRQEPGATIIVCHHRWHQDDLTAWLLEKSGEPWEHVRLPHLAEQGDPLGRKPGAALCPARFGIDQVLGMRRSTGEFFDALHQQAPRQIGTGNVYYNFGAWNIGPPAMAPRDDLPLCLDLDININPGMHGLISQYCPRADLFSFFHEFHGPRMTVMELLVQFRKWIHARGGWKWPASMPLLVYGDASGSTPTAQVGESHYDYVRGFLNRAGVPFRFCVPASNPPIVERLATFNDALKDMDDKSHVLIHPQCERLIADMKGLKSNESGQTDKSDNALSHASEAAGYQIHYVRPVGGPIKVPRGRFSVAVN